jgi:ankyrin repeat protein
MTRAVRFLALFPGLCLLGAPAAWSGGSLRLAQIAPSEAELRIYAGLHAAAAEGDAVAIERLIAARAPLDHFNALGFTALIEAVVLGNGSAAHGSVVAALARAGADVNLTDRQGMTALAHAEARGYRDMASVLAATEPRPTRTP